MGDKKDEDKDKRPAPPEKVDNPLPMLAKAMEALGAMQARRLNSHARFGIVDDRYH
jgi:hypothetical protein